MTSVGDRGERACGESPRRDRRQPLSRRARTDASSSRASPSVRWVFTLCLHLLICRDADLCFLIGVGLHLIRMRWSLSYRGNSLPGRGSWIARKVSSPRGRMDWQPLSVPLERCSQNVTSVTFELRLSSRTSSPRHMSLAPGPNSSSTSIGHWRNTRSSFAYRKQTWRCER
jgi:hypothetical protein